MRTGADARGNERSRSDLAGVNVMLERLLPRLRQDRRVLIAGALAGLVAVAASSPLWVPPRPVLWSQARTWGGARPGAGTSVDIPAGKAVILDVSPPKLAQLTIEGRLIVPVDRDTRLEAGAIVVTGSLSAGTSRGRMRGHLTIVLDGTADGGGTLGAFTGGHIDLWGPVRTAWVHLAKTAAAHERDLVLDTAPDWQPGDRIAIAPSGFDSSEAEERRILAIDGTHVRLDAPLAYRHWGTATDGVDERAEVGLLTHAITIESDAAGASGRGGQVMIMRGGTLHASGVTFAHLGQRAQLGRYPVHFHLAGDERGSFVEASSIVHSNNRCIAIHGTENVVVRDDVAYDTIGHCYFLEDGVETGNVLEHDLGLATRAADARTAILDSDTLPATFWISNPANIVRDDAAAGSQGSGFWYNLAPHPTGPSATQAIWPRRTPLGDFSGNVAHANEMNGLFVDILRNPPGVTEAPNYDPPTLADFRSFTSYKNRRRGAWLRGTNLRLSHAVIADNSIGVTFAGAAAVLQDSLVVGETGNATGPPKPFEADFPIRGFEFYDGQVGVVRTLFRNFVPNAARRASALGTLQYSPFFTDPSNFAQGLTFDRAQPVYFATHHGVSDRLGADGYRSTVFVDADGSVTGLPRTSVVLDTPLHADRDCARHPQWNALVCSADYASLFLIGVDAGARSPGPVRITRTDTAAYLTLYGNPATGTSPTFATNLRGDRVYAVTFGNGFPRHLQIGLHHLPAGHGVTLLFPQAPHGTSISRDNATVATHERRPGEALRVQLTAGAAGKDVLDLRS